MQWAALIAWVATAGVGSTLLAIWLFIPTAQEEPRVGRRIGGSLILGHFLLAVGGLVIWIVYLVSDEDALAWVAFVVLAVVAVLGWRMFLVWLRQRRLRTSAWEEMRRAESRFPVPIVALHGVLAVATAVTVFLTAIGVGD